MSNKSTGNARNEGEQLMKMASPITEPEELNLNLFYLSLLLKLKFLSLHRKLHFPMLTWLIWLWSPGSGHRTQSHNVTQGDFTTLLQHHCSLFLHSHLVQGDSVSPAHWGNPYSDKGYHLSLTAWR